MLERANPAMRSASAPVSRRILGGNALDHPACSGIVRACVTLKSASWAGVILVVKPPSAHGPLDGPSRGGGRFVSRTGGARRTPHKELNCHEHQTAGLHETIHQLCRCRGDAAFCPPRPTTIPALERRFATGWRREERGKPTTNRRSALGLAARRGKSPYVASYRAGLGRRPPPPPRRAYAAGR
jgi:hypothetical protein